MLADMEAGDCVCSRVDGRVRVVKADPIIHICNELLDRADCGLVVEGDLVMVGDDDPVMYRITERGAREVEAVRVD